MRNRPEDKITLVLIRHGAAKSNIERRYLGKTDEDLFEEGKRQLCENKKKGLFPDIDFLFVSPMKRCIQTAEILYPELEPEEIGEWKEMDFGIFEGKNYIELKDDKRYIEWINSKGTLPFPGGESREAFIERCIKGFRRMTEILKSAGNKRYRVGMIVHGGTIMAVLSTYAKGDYFDYQVPSGKGFVCTVNHFYTEPEIAELKKI